MREATIRTPNVGDGLGWRRASVEAAQSDETNRLLKSLSVDEYERIMPELRPARLDFKQVLIAPNADITDVYFIRSGIGSMIASAGDGIVVEAGTMGWEGFVGLPVLHGVSQSTYEIIVQVEGTAWRMRAATFRRLLDEIAGLREVCHRYAQYFSDQIAQSVACNRLHSLEERCARWLLMTRDRAVCDTFNLTQEFLAVMLGVRRSGVSVVMSAFQRDGCITHTRGSITVLDHARLEAASCSCYRITRAAMARVLAPAAQS